MTGRSIAEHVAEWAPEPVEVREVLDSRPSDAFAALLDQPSPAARLDAVVPPLWTALHFLDISTTADLGDDGHPRVGHFLPPIPSRRRMFAGGRLAVHAPLRAGDDVVRRSSLRSVTPKTGRSGEMLFVTVGHDYVREGEVVQTEEHDLVYRSQESGAPRDPGAGRTAPPAASELPVPRDWQIVLRPDEVTLFRMSALTMNAHRIHYDLAYTRGVEGFPALVVHGPLLALLLLELPRRFAPDLRVQQYSYRLRRPAFCGIPIIATGKPDGSELAGGASGVDPSITGHMTFARV